MLSAELPASSCCSCCGWQPWGFCPGQGGQCCLIATASPQHQPACMLLSPFGEAAQCFWTQCRICPSFETECSACLQRGTWAESAASWLSRGPPRHPPAACSPGASSLQRQESMPHPYHLTSLWRWLESTLLQPPLTQHPVRRSMHEEGPPLLQPLQASKTHLELLAASSARHLAALVSGCSVPPGHQSPAAGPGQLMFQGAPWLAAGTL